MANVMASDQAAATGRWGGTPDRNMVSNAKGSSRNGKGEGQARMWRESALGSQTYGNPASREGAGIGTNNEAVRDPRQTGDMGILMCFRESDGEFLWQDASPKLPPDAERLAVQGVLVAAGGR